MAVSILKVFLIGLMSEIINWDNVKGSVPTCKLISGCK